MINKNIDGEENKIEIISSKLNEVNIKIKGSNNNIYIGENVVVKGKLDINIESNNCNVVINKNTTFENTAIGLAEDKTEVIIGEDCMFATETLLLASDYHSIFDLKTGKRTNYAKKIELGNHVWVGTRAIILKNVNIGSGTIIGAGSVIHKSNEKNCVVNGSPSKVIKNDVYWTRNLVEQKEFPLINLPENPSSAIKYYIEKNLTESNYILGGWAFLEEKNNNDYIFGIIVEDKNGNRHAYSTTRYLSEDVAEFYHNSNYNHVRFDSVIGVPIEEVYKVFLVVKGKKTYYIKLIEKEDNKPIDKKRWFKK